MKKMKNEIVKENIAKEEVKDQNIKVFSGGATSKTVLDKAGVNMGNLKEPLKIIM